MKRTLQEIRLRIRVAWSVLTMQIDRDVSSIGLLPLSDRASSFFYEAEQKGLSLNEVTDTCIRVYETTVNYENASKVAIVRHETNKAISVLNLKTLDMEQPPKEVPGGIF
jgi:hypothetical protein